MTIVRWRPFSGMLSLREAMDDLLQRSMIYSTESLQGVRQRGLLLNVWQDAESLHIVAQVPGLTADDLNITTTGSVLTIRGEYRQDAPQNESECWYYHEVERGAFERTLVLPSGVEPGKAEANVNNGLLHITVPRVEAEKPRTIKVKAA